MPHFEKYPYARAATSAANAQQIIGWNTFFTLEGNLNQNNGNSLIVINIIIMVFCL